MIKRILVPLDASPYAKNALNFACKIAQQLDSEITGLVILDLPGIEKSIGPIPAGGLYYAEQLEKTKTEEAKKQIDRIMDDFEKKCRDEGVRFAKSQQQGCPSENIVREAVYYDAVIIGMRTYFQFGAKDDSGDSLEEILDSCITPIYAVPKSFEIVNFPAMSMNVCIAFDGSLPAARAMQRFTHLRLPDHLQVTVLNSNKNKDEAQYLLDRAESFLMGHGFRNIKKDWTNESIIKAVENQYLDKMDLFVVGANSKNDLLDFFLGSLTKTLIKKDKKPVLIGQ
ncbi:MAG: universal stress protein [Calditrichaceae bacterium]|nr:universal stress protein [Calditrichaceae bacterium]MBN2708564.1 universal stress protein [Calditrichaceae bacterium]RQV96873.1 MAG: universal stress protein [Calditrichota bacterium]